MVAWSLVCRPVEYGSLDIHNLNTLGSALRLRWLWLQRTNDFRPWRGLPYTASPMEVDMFQASVWIHLGDGMRCRFWSDRWLDGQSIIFIAPLLVKCVSKVARKKRLVATGLHNDGWVRDITGQLAI